MLDRRAICATCGHTQEWHDRASARSLLGEEPPIERPCYREIGGAPCRCGAFRESGEVAVAARGGPAPYPSRNRVVRQAALTVLLVVMGLALLYAYRSQTPAVPIVSVTQAIQEIQSGRVRAVTITANLATLELTNGTREQTTIPEPDAVFAKAILDYNAANPSHAVELRYEQTSQTGTVIGSIVLSLLPVLLIGGFFYYLMMRARERR